MAGAIDENNTIKQLEFDRNKSMDYRVVLRKCHENARKWVKMAKNSQNRPFQAKNDLK